MPAFQLLNPFRVKIAAVLLPAKKKGRDVIHTTDIVVDFEGANDVILPLFDPELLHQLYRELREGEKPEQAGLDGIDAVSRMAVLRSTTLRMPLPLDLEFTGYRLEIDYGLGKRASANSNIQIDAVTVKRIRVWAKEGGTVKGEMHLQSQNVAGDQVGKLRDMLKTETSLTLRAPAMQTDIDQEQQQRQAKGEKSGGVPGQGKGQQRRGQVVPIGQKIARATNPKGGKGKGKANPEAATKAFLDAHGTEGKPLQ